MSKQKTIHLAYGIFLSVLTIAVGIVFVVQAADIYYDGKADPLTPAYSVDTIKAHLLLPVIFLFVWIAAIVVGLVLFAVYPYKSKQRPSKNYAVVLDTLKTLVPREGEEFADVRNRLDRMSVARKAIWYATFAVLSVMGVLTAAYVFDPAHYHADAMREDILNLVRNVIWWAVISLICVFAAIIYELVSLRREVDLARRSLSSVHGTAQKKQEQATPKQKTAIILIAVVTTTAIALFVMLPSIVTMLIRFASSQSDNAFAVILSTSLMVLALVTECVVVFAKFIQYLPEKAKSIIKLSARIVVVVIAVAFVIVGIFNGGARDVFIKAVNICTECIGLG